MAVPTIRPHSTHQKPFMVPSIKWLSTPAARITSAVAVYSPRFKARCGSVPSLARTKNVAITEPRMPTPHSTSGKIAAYNRLLTVVAAKAKVMAEIMEPT